MGCAVCVGSFGKRLRPLGYTRHVEAARDLIYLGGKAGVPHAGTCTHMHMGNEASLALFRASFGESSQEKEQLWRKITSRAHIAAPCRGKIRAPVSPAPLRVAVM